MNVKRYFATTAREAFRALKEELGADAIVLSNRAVDGGVEILALPADGADALHELQRSAPTRAAAPAPSRAQPEPRPAPAPVARDDEDADYTVNLFRPARSAEAPREARPAANSGSARDERSEPVIRPFTPPRVDSFGRPCDTAPEEIRPTRQERPAPARQAARNEEPALPDLGFPAPRAAAEDPRLKALQEANERLMTEMGSIRQLLERQLAGFAWGESARTSPARNRTMSALLEAGFSAAIARRLAEMVPGEAGPEEAGTVIRNALNRGLKALANDDDIIDRGGVYALVGPTGVGKTTTTAKLAARCVVRHGSERVALITTDGYRIGAQEQLRIYGRILGVPVFSVRDANELRQTLHELAHKHIVLIDTVGVSQRDRMVAEQAAMLLGAGDVRRLLLLNSTCRGDTLDDVVRAYKGPDLAGCIFSKVDEAVSLAPVLDVAIRHQLELFYIASGQRVPEDLHLPNRDYLFSRALRGVTEHSPWHLKDEEAGLMMAGAAMGV